MGAKTKIEWCDSSWSPVTGCNHGCEYCYARGIAERFGGYDACTKIGDAAHISDKSLENPKIVETWEELSFQHWSKKKEDGSPADGAKLVRAPYPFGFTPTFHTELLDKPQHWKKSKNIFVCSMADLFGDWVPDKWIAEVFHACEKAPQHRYLFLTKNPKRYIELAKVGNLLEKDNIWYGSTTTTPNQSLLYSSCNTFVSVEPILKDFSGRITDELDYFETLKWVIIGAETGNRKGKVIPEASWIKDILELCKLMNIPVFMKDSLIPIVGEENMRREFPWE